MTNRRLRLDKLRALANDPGATESERALAAEHIARIQESAMIPDTERFVDVGEGLIDAVNRAMARAGSVRNSAYRAARVRAAEHRLGSTAMRQWRDGQGPALGRGSR